MSVLFRRYPFHRAVLLISVTSRIKEVYFLHFRGGSTATLPQQGDCVPGGLLLLIVLAGSRKKITERY
jgi:hypothetical protein